MRRIRYLAMVGVLAFSACSSDSGGGSGSGDTEPTDPTECIDADGGSASMDLVQASLTRGVKDLSDLDLAGGAQELRNAAEYAADAADASEADAAVSTPLNEASDLFESAAQNLESVSSLTDTASIDEATSDIKAAGELIDEAKSALAATELEDC